ncbi:MAG: efflux transporter outer membrane subunit [Geobacteraceae bacterium]|nr:efflux transporter outer membrane subunit [Geobacteraceae bacterium]
MKNTGLSAAATLLSCLLLSACTVGPDYVRPTPLEKTPAAYKELEGWKVAQPQDARIQKGWWKIYHDPLLDSLAEQVAVSNQNVAQVEAQYRQARAMTQGARAGYFPTVAVAPSASRTKSSANLGSSKNGGATTSTFQLPLDATWEPDLWGRIRRTVESSEANAQASSADLAAVTLSAQAEMVNDYLQLRIVDAQKQLLSDTVEMYRKSLEITRNRYSSGIAAKTDVLQAETLLKSTEAQLVDSGVQRAQLEHAIAVLLGKSPSSFSLSPVKMIAAVPEVPTGVPSELLERRADIAMAERKMAAANAQIGVAEAARYPTIQLSAMGGLSSSALSTLFNWPSRVWSLGAGASANLFDGGLRKAQSEQAVAAYDASVAAYRETVLTAFQEVEDNLAALRILGEESTLQDQAVQAARQSAALTINQYAAGTVAYLNVLVAQTTALANERTALGISGRKLTASVLLFKALGGGWDQQMLK